MQPERTLQFIDIDGKDGVKDTDGDISCFFTLKGALQEFGKQEGAWRGPGKVVNKW